MTHSFSQYAPTTPVESDFCIRPLALVGGSCEGRLQCSYAQLVARLGEANATHLDDTAKVPASWGFTDAQGREGFIWAYRSKAAELPTLTSWSVAGNRALLEQVFPQQLTWFYAS